MMGSDKLLALAQVYSLCASVTAVYLPLFVFGNVLPRLTRGQANGNGIHISFFEVITALKQFECPGLLKEHKSLVPCVVFASSVQRNQFTSAGDI